MNINFLRRIAVGLTQPSVSLRCCRFIETTNSGSKCNLPWSPSTESKANNVETSRPNLYANEVEQRVNQYLNYELNASLECLSMANFFTAEQPWHGFAAMYYVRSCEKRSNAINLMGYQNRRGGNTSITNVRKPRGSWLDAKDSLVSAMDMESSHSEFLNSFHSIAQMKFDNLTMDLITGECLRRPIAHFHFYKQLLTRLQLDGTATAIYLMDKELHNEFAHYAPDDFDKLIAKNFISQLWQWQWEREGGEYNSE